MATTAASSSAATDARTLSWLALSLAPGVGPVTGDKLVAAAGGDVTRVVGLSAAAMADLPGIGTTTADRLVSAIRHGREEAPIVLDRCRSLGHHVITRDDPAFPAMLRLIYDPPLVLYVWGQLLPQDVLSVAVVGSRRCSLYGSEQARRFASMFVSAAHTVVSGGARGIDSAAHEGALADPNGRTIAVTGCGLDVHYPPENQGLFERISRRGAVVSEYPPGTQVTRQNFPRRNRIISGLSRGVLVVEAEEISGALITARVAADDHNRPVFALPGRIDNPSAAGPNQLIRDGAILVTRPQDVLDELGDLPEAADAQLHHAAPASPSPLSPPSGLFESPLSPPTRAPAISPAPALPLTPAQQSIVSALTGSTLTIDQIIEITGLDPATVMGQMTMLSLRGAVARADGGTFTARSPKAK